jgi:hypothetical protein
MGKHGKCAEVPPQSNPKLKLMEQVREVLRYHRYAYRTEQTYCQYILRYIHYFGGKTQTTGTILVFINPFFVSHLFDELDSQPRYCTF